MKSAERLAKNEAFFRTVNEEIEGAALGHSEGLGDGHVYSFLCECADLDCEERVDLTLPEYELVRADGRRFVVFPGHVADGYEHVVQRERGHEVVRKDGAAGEAAVRLNPRAA
jgi:hypothetical protein